MLTNVNMVNIGWGKMFVAWIHHLTHSLHYPMWREGKRQLDHKNIFCRTCPARSDKGKGGVAP